MFLARYAVLALAFCALGLAADITGKWKATMETPNGTRESVFEFKADGSTLTGTVTGGRGGPAEIKEGKIEGDMISFVVVRNFQGEERKIPYKGKVSGNEMKLTMSFGEREVEMTAKKE